jgi:iron complex outermembrane receptor protein
MDMEEDDPKWEEMSDKLYESLSQLYARKDMPARAIFNVGADYKIGHLTLGLNIHNLLNTRYDRSGMNTNLVPQQGRWWQISIGYKI